MINRIVLVVLFLIFSENLIFSDIVEIQLPAGSQFTVNPRENLSIPLNVINQADIAIDFTPEVIHPDKWAIIISDSAFTLEPGESSLRLISIQIPRNTPAGNYDIQYILNSSLVGALATVTMSVKVAQSTELKLELLSAPDYVIAGESYKITYYLYNLGNHIAFLDYKIKSSEQIPYSLNTETENLIVKPEEPLEIDIKIDTPHNIDKVMIHRVELNIPVPENYIWKKNLKALRGVSYVEVLPHISDDNESYMSLPARLLNTGTGEFLSGNRYEHDVQFKAKGPLDDSSFHNIDVYLKKRLKTDIDDPLELADDPNDKYKFKYWNPSLNVIAGDYGFGLSPLLELYRYGRGIEIDGTVGPYNFGGYFHQTRFSSIESKYGAAFFQWSLSDLQTQKNPNYLLRGNIYTANANNLLSSLYQEWNPLPTLNLSGDLALGINAEGNVSPALWMESNGKFDRIGYTLNLRYADPYFEGFYQDQYHISVGNTIEFLNKSLQLFTAFQMDENNLLRNEDKGSAYHQNLINAGISWYINHSSTSLFFKYINRNRKDLLQEYQYDDWENSGVISFRQALDKLQLNLSAEVSYKTNLVDLKNILKQTYRARFGYQPNSLFNSYFGLNYESDNFSENYYNSIHNLGWNLNFEYSNKQLNINGEAENYFILMNDKIAGVSFDIGLGLHTAFENKHELDVKTKFLINNSQNQWNNNISLIAEYNIPFSLPIGKKTNIGSLSGRVFDNITKEAIKDVVLRIEGKAVVTDDNGKYKFSSLTPGIYYLNIDRKKLGNNRIPKLQTPIKITITKGYNETFDIPIVNSASISGRIVVFDFSEDINVFHDSEDYSNSESKELIEKGGLGNVLVELSNGEYNLRRLSDEKGRFNFEELYAGEWELSVLNTHLEDFQYLEMQKYYFTLNPGENKTQLIRILPKTRKINFLDDSLLGIDSPVLEISTPPSE